MIATANPPSLSDLSGLTTKVIETGIKSTSLLMKKQALSEGTPVFTRQGRYTSRGWTEWTQGFQYGNALYLFDAADDKGLLEWGKTQTLTRMAAHLTHTGVHDHGFNIISTYGNLLRLAREGRISVPTAEEELYRSAIMVSGAVQASRWTRVVDNLGFICSFNGGHSLFADTIRTLRVLALAHQFGHLLMGEQDKKISLFKRLLQHMETTSRYTVYFGKDRDRYDIRGRVAHESLFNPVNGTYRCPSTQQGYSPYTTWTRGHAWILLGYAELLEWLDTRTEDEFIEAAVPGMSTKNEALNRCLETAEAAADFYIEQTPTDGICYWDTGAPGLVNLPDYQDKPADPFNPHEPVDSSSAAICAQGLFRLGRFRGDGSPEGERYTAAALRVCETLFKGSYLAEKENHEGILIHTVYHRPNGWDYIPEGSSVPNGESALWGDYHLLELAVYVQRLAESRPYLTFFAGM